MPVSRRSGEKDRESQPKPNETRPGDTPPGQRHPGDREELDDSNTGGGGSDTGDGTGGRSWGGGGGGGGGGDDGPARWVTVASFSIPTEAHLARLRLESEDIDCVIVDEHLVSTNWLLSPAVGGIKVQVPEDQAPEARRVLKSEGVGWDESEAEALAKCAACGLGEYAPAEHPKWVFALSVALLGIPLLFMPRVWRCTHCRTPMG